jgi:hypothetical protein
VGQGQGGGQPTKYRPIYCKQAKALTKLGATDMELARFFEVNVDTINLWKLTHPKFSEALKLGKAPSNKRIEQSLYNRARGYSYESEEIFLIDVTEERPGPTPEAPKIIVRTKEVKRVPVIKHVPPDPTSMIFWLKNRKRGEWRDKHNHELSTPPGQALEVAGVPLLLRDYYAKIAQSAAALDPDPAAPDPVGSDRPGGEESGSDEDAGPR